MNVMNARAVTHQLANIYQPNMVLNQCVSMLMIQSQADTEELTAKNNRNQVERPLALSQYFVVTPLSRSSESICLLIQVKNRYHMPKKITMRAIKNTGK